MLLLSVNFANSGREIHHTAIVVAVFETHRVSHFVDDFFPDAIGKDILGTSLGETAIR